jgi:hypothetical protein
MGGVLCTLFIAAVQVARQAIQQYLLGAQAHRHADAGHHLCTAQAHLPPSSRGCQLDGTGKELPGCSGHATTVLTAVIPRTTHEKTEVTMQTSMSINMSLSRVTCRAALYASQHCIDYLPSLGCCCFMVCS